MASLTHIEQQALIDVRNVLTQKYRNNLILLKLFGSKARSDSQPFSDIDLLAVVEKDSWQASDKMSDDVFEIIEKYNYELLISLIVLDQKEFELEKKSELVFMRISSEKEQSCGRGTEKQFTKRMTSLCRSKK